jgi:hypothetical protein
VGYFKDWRGPDRFDWVACRIERHRTERRVYGCPGVIGCLAAELLIKIGERLPFWLRLGRDRCRLKLE